MDASFRRCVFGGFDREDVVAFIEKTAEETRVQVEALQAENDALRREKEDTANQNAVLRRTAEEAAHLAEENGALREQLAALQTEMSALRAECDALRHPAAEYQALKEHIADIEISAHRRTEEFRARAMDRLAQCIAQQRAWCSQRRSSYLTMNAALLEQLRRAEEEVDSADYAAFDSMLSELQRLEDELRQGNDGL